MKKNILVLIRIIAAFILLQTLFFKFTGATESVYIFQTLHAEPWGRWVSGISELIAAVLILIPATQLIGSLLSAAIMSGALLSHVFVLGIEVQDDSGTLFFLACTVFIINLIIIFYKKEELIKIMKQKSLFIVK